MTAGGIRRRATAADRCEGRRSDFLIAGKPVAIMPRQRKEVLTYRAQYLEIARQGIALGHEGVDLADQ